MTRVSTDPFWIVAAIWLSPLAVLPWTSVPAMSSVTPFVLLACAIGHLGSIIVSWRLGRGSASRTFARM